MKALWQLPGEEADGTWIGDTWPSWTTAHAAGVNRFYFQTHMEKVENGKVVGYVPNARQINDDYRSSVIGVPLQPGGAERFQYGVVYQPYWDGNPSSERTVALALHGWINLATNSNKYAVCPAMFNMEFPYRDPAWLIAMFRYWRTLRPTRRTCWVLEGIQGGWIKASAGTKNDLVAYINGDPYLWIMAECFLGDMTPLDPAQVRKDLIGAGIHPEKVLLCYDAAKPRDTTWNGMLFQSGRLAA